MYVKVIKIIIPIFILYIKLFKNFIFHTCDLYAATYRHQIMLNHPLLFNITAAQLILTSNQIE